MKQGDIMRKNISVLVYLSHFQKFDHGEEVVQDEKDLNISPGDTFDWHCAQFDGMAQSVSYENGKLKFKKIS